jgi:hypothetical protein
MAAGVVNSQLRRDARFGYYGCLALGGAAMLLIAGLAALIVLGVNWLTS